MLLAPHLSHAQEESESSSFALTGTSRFEAQDATQKGVGQDIPARYARWELNPTFVLFDIPFSGAMLLSTEQSRGRQSINSFNLSFSLSNEQLQERLRQRLIARIARPAFEGTIEGVEDLESIETALSDPSSLADLESLRARAESGTATSDELEELREKEEELEGLKERYEDLKTIREKVGEAEDLRRVAETGYATEKMYDPENLHGALDQLQMLSGMEKFFYNFPRFGIGVNYPHYSPYTISGIPVNGVDIIFNPGKFYVAATVGEAQRDVPETFATDSTFIAYNRSIYAGRIGYGRTGEGHALLTIMHASDDENAIISDTASGFYLSPQENWLLGLDIDLPIIPEVFSIKGEIAGSLLTGDLNSPGAEIDSSLDAPEWLTDLVQFRTSSFVDYAFSIEPQLTIRATDTRLKGKVERVGPGYVTLGIPYLRNDLLRYEGQVEQKFWRKQIRLTGRIRRETDNLIDWKQATTETTMYSLGLGLAFRGLPFLRLGYIPYRQKNDGGTEFQVDNRISIYTALIGHRYRFSRSFGATTTASFSMQDVETLGDRFNSTTKTYTLGQTFSIGTWLSLNATGSLTEPTSVIDTLVRNSVIDLGATVTFLQDWNATLGGTLFDEENTSSKVGYYAGLYIPVSSIGSALDIRAEKNVFDATNTQLTGIESYDETIVRASFVTQW